MIHRGSLSRSGVMDACSLIIARKLPHLQDSRGPREERSHLRAEIPTNYAGILGTGAIAPFVFDDTDEAVIRTSTMRQILASDARYGQRILPYLGGKKLNTSPTQSADRYAYNLSDVKDESELEKWPALAESCGFVKPYREKLGENPNNVPLKRRWWAYQAHRPELDEMLARMRRVLADCAGHRT